MKIRSLILSAVALTWASVGLATPPEIFSFTDVDDLPITDCGDFEVWTMAPLKIRVKLSFNDSGDVVRVQVHGNILSSIYYNRGDPDIFVTQGKKGVGENFYSDEDLITGEFHQSGGNFRLTLPGIGHVVMFMGTFKVDAGGNFVFHGLDAFPEGDTEAALCAALSP